MSYELLDKKFNDKCLYTIWYELEHKGLYNSIIKNFLESSPPDLHRNTFFSFVIENDEFNNIIDLIDNILKNTTNYHLEKFNHELINFFTNTILPYLP